MLAWRWAAGSPQGWRRILAATLAGLWAVVASGTARADEAAIVASSPMRPYVAALTARMQTRLPAPPPVEVVDSVRSAVERFCAPGRGGLVHGLAMHRRLNRFERQQCRDAGIDPTEVALGVEAAVLAVPRNGKVARLPLDDLFRAVIRELPDEGRFHANAAQTWRQLDPSLPDETISVLLPAAPLAARAVLDERGLQVVCRKLPAMQAIYAAAERTRRCVTPRDDDRVRQYADLAALAEAMDAASPGTVAVLSYGAYRRLAARLLVLPVEGVVADDGSISSEAYPLSRRVYLYLRQPEPARLGAADSHRLAQIADAVSDEQAQGPGGVFATAGLVPLPLEERARQRQAVLGRHAGIRP